MKKLTIIHYYKGNGNYIVVEDHPDYEKVKEAFKNYSSYSSTQNSDTD